MSRAAIVSCACLLGCAPAIVAPPPPRVPSTHRDPPPHLPTPGEQAPGAVVALAASAGDEQARDLVVALAIAVRDQDAAALESLLAPAILFLSTLRQGRTPASVGASAFARQLLSSARLAQIRSDARLEDLLDPASIRVDPIASAFAEGLPRELAPGDRLVRFGVTALGRRAFAVLAHEGVIALVIRPGEGARIIAR